MEKIFEFISKSGNTVIIICGLALLVAMFMNYNKLSSQKERIGEILDRRNKKYRKNKDTQELEEEDDESSSVTPDTIRNYENTFNELCSLHNAFSQLIPVFPLLGVLGTVSGLILNAKAGNTEQMLTSLNTALYTTFFGLISAIILKVFDTLFPSKTINDVEVMLDDFDKKMDLADMEMTKIK